MFINSNVINAIEPPIAEAQSWIAGRSFSDEKPLINLAQAVPSYPPAQSLQEHLATRTRLFQTAQYTEISGIPELRSSLSTHMNKVYNGNTSLNNVLISSGCNQAYCLTIMALAKAGDEIILPEPYYFNHLMWLEMLGIKAKLMPFKPDQNGIPNPLDAERLVTKKTKAIMPIHLTGDVADMPKIMEIADCHQIPVIEDGCQSLLGERDGKQVSSWGIATGFSMHPLKIINVWGDAGIIVTNDDEMNRQARLLRNHGLKNRDEMQIFGYNSRLDSVQAIVGKWMVRQVDSIVSVRAQKAKIYDDGFSSIPEIQIPPRQPNTKNVFLLYMVFAQNRDGLLDYCLKKGIEAKIHYPIPLYQQPALAHLDYKKGDFPVTDRHAKECISFPVDQHISDVEQDYVIETVRSFYRDSNYG